MLSKQLTSSSRLVVFVGVLSGIIFLWSFFDVRSGSGFGYGSAEISMILVVASIGYLFLRWRIPSLWN